MTRQIVKTMCPMNCHPTLCGMKVTVDEGKVVEITGDETNPDSQGFLCMRGNAAHEIVDNPARLTTPLIRDSRNDEFRAASWEEAYGLITTRMQAAGREAVALWPGHGMAVNDYSFGAKGQLIERFANLYGCQRWNPAMICWGLGGFGFGLTGALATSTKEDMSQNSDLILLWGANTASQANTTRHVIAAKARGARVVAIDVRRTEACALADEVLILRPGTDTALGLAMAHVIVNEGLHDADFVAGHTLGFEDFADHLRAFTPDWAATETGLAADVIIALARRYAATKAAMIVAGGSSIHKGDNAWRAARAISCLPGLTGAYGTAGGGIGPRHGSASYGRKLGNVTAIDRRLPGRYIPPQMEAIVKALETGDTRVLLTLGSNILSSFPEANRLAKGLARTDLVVNYDIFMNETARQFADVVLPGTIWLEEIGAKSTNTHIYLSDQALTPAGEARPIYRVLAEMADLLGVEGYYPWASQDEVINQILNTDTTGHATVDSLRENEGRVELGISHVAYPDRQFDSPSGKIEFSSKLAVEMGLPALPPANGPARAAKYPLNLAHGRTWNHFHSFYDQGRALPTLKARDPEPELWISPPDAAARGVEDGASIAIFNDGGRFSALAKVTKRIPQGVVWMRDGWAGLNALTECAAVLPEAALTHFPFSVGQSSYASRVDFRLSD